MKKGMLRTILAMALVLMLALMPSLSMAAPAQFGALTSSLMSKAWQAGREINVRLSVNLDKLNGTGLEDEETQQAMAAVGQLLDIAAINVSAVKIEDGVRITANAELSEQNVISGAVEVTSEKITAETNVLPGKRLVVSMEDMKAMTGAQEMDAEQATAMVAMVKSYLTEAAARYGAVLSTWAETLEVVEGPGTEATETCDKIDCTYTTTITGKEIKTLLAALIDEALTDETLLSAIHSLGLTDDEGNAIDVAGELAEAKAEIEADTELDGIKLTLVQGMNEEKVMVSMAMVLDEEGSDDAMLAKAEIKSDENGGYVATVEMSARDGETEIMTYDYTVTYACGDNDAQLTSINGTMMMNDDDQVVTMDIAADGTTTVTDTAETSSVSENVRMVMEAGDGETYTRDNMDMKLGMTIATQDLGDDFETVWDYDLGMEGNIEGEVMEMLFGMAVRITSGEYAPSTEPLTDVDVLTLDEEGMEALSAEAEAGLMQAVFTAMSLLPQDVLALLMAE